MVKSRVAKKKVSKKSSGQNKTKNRTKNKTKNKTKSRSSGKLAQMKKVKSKRSGASSKGAKKAARSSKGAGAQKPIRKKTAKQAESVKRTSAQKSPSAEHLAHTMVGHAAPDLVRPATGGKNISLKDFAGKNVVLYFYPKDSTPGCTLEGQDFRRLIGKFESENTVVLGVSKDSLKSHESFRQKCDFPFDLISDEDETLCRAFGVIQMKSLYGRHYEGIVRSTFVIDAEGRVVREWRNVKVNGHADEVLEYVSSLAR